MPSGGHTAVGGKIGRGFRESPCWCYSGGFWAPQIYVFITSGAVNVKTLRFSIRCLWITFPKSPAFLPQLAASAYCQHDDKRVPG